MEGQELVSERLNGDLESPLTPLVVGGCESDLDGVTTEPQGRPVCPQICGRRRLDPLPYADSQGRGTVGNRWPGVYLPVLCDPSDLGFIWGQGGFGQWVGGEYIQG